MYSLCDLTLILVGMQGGFCVRIQSRESFITCGLHFSLHCPSHVVVTRLERLEQY